MIVSVVVMGTILILSIRISTNRSLSTDDRLRSSLIGAALLCTIVQALHFSEEWATGFHIRMPALFGLQPISESVFVVFNVTWILIWLAAVALLRTGRSLLLFTLWFLGLAAGVNLVFHPLAAVYVGGYFPGLYTSFLVGGAGIFLIKKLSLTTEPVRLV